MSKNITAFITTGKPTSIFSISPAPKRRKWMDVMTHGEDKGTPYRCLPMLIANQWGWIVECPAAFETWWDSTRGVVRTVGVPLVSQFAKSHFGQGILTFELDFFIRTPERVNLWVRGAPNYFKDGIVALEGMVETDWLPFHFTMNWKFTRPDTVVRFSKGDPICFLVPYPRGYLQDFDPAFAKLASDPDLHEQYIKYMMDRKQQEGKARGRYLAGTDGEGDALAEHHESLLNLPAFASPNSKDAKVDP